MKILIIDDEEAILKMYGERLEKEGFQVFMAHRGQEGIDMAIKEKPNLIFLDIIMPELNGLDVLKILKTKEETQKIPVFLLTNLPEECSEEKARSLGAAGYFVKVNYEPRKLVETIKDLGLNTN